MINCLLVEPDYKAKYPNLALMKLSTKLKNEGKNVDYFKGMKPKTLDHDYHEIYITTLFTYQSKITIETIKHYKRGYPKAEIQIGGIFASLMPDYVEEQTGIKPFLGYSKELDSLKPDYDLIKRGDKYDDYSFVFTTRGCPNKCPYCAVPTIEKEDWINPNWKTQVNYNRINISLLDNNLTSQPIEHFKTVMRHMKKYKFNVVIESGLDARLFTDEHLGAMKGVKFLRQGIRFAFDDLSRDVYIQDSLMRCLNAGFKPTQIMVYVLFNFNETPFEAEWRCRELVKLGITPYPQRYTPLMVLSRDEEYTGKYWSDELAMAFRQFYQPQRKSTFCKHTFPEWLELTGKPELLEDYYRYPWSKP